MITEEKTGKVAIEVELDIFSGRENPRWQLAPEMTSKLVDLLLADEVRSSVPTPAAAPGLGYRGFLVRVRSATLKLPPELRVYKGVTSVLSATADKHVLLPALEELLLSDAVRQGHAELLREFGVHTHDSASTQ